MSGFEASWLDLREPADMAARDPGLLEAFTKALPGDAPRILDLGSGTGSTLRAISPLVPQAKWRLTDDDPVLLAEAKRRAPQADVEQVDLASRLEDVLKHGADAVTASALIDLVSAKWLDRLADAVESDVLYLALNYDGTEQWSPKNGADAEILAAFGRHQRSDKGFGPALGSEAVPYLTKKLEDKGYAVRIADSPWHIENSQLISALAEGIAGAAQEVGVPADVVRRWLQARKQADHCAIGHVDLLAVR